MGTPISKVPYLMQGLLDWMVDSGSTPYLILNARMEGVSVPGEFVQPDGSITLNISGTAVRNLNISADGVFFDSRFKGLPVSISAPIQAVLGLVSRETGDGLWFPENAPGPAAETPLVDEHPRDGHEASGSELSGNHFGSKPKPTKASHLSVVE